MSAIDSSSLNLKREDLSFFLKDYNEMLARILIQKSESLDYVSSPTLNRQESLTHLYEKIESYRQIRDLLLSEKKSIRLVGKHVWLYSFLKKEFGDRVFCDGVEKKANFYIDFLKFYMKSLLVFVLGKIKDDGNLKNARVLLRTYFDHRCLRKDGTVREEYFGDFTEDLGKREKLLLVFKFMSIHNLKDYWHAKRSLNYKRLTLENLIGFWGILRGFYRFSKSRIVLSEKCVFRGLDVSALVQKSMDEDFLNFQNLGVFLEYEASLKILKSGIHTFYYPYENQPWEKIYPLVKKQLHASTYIIGFQHTGVSYKLLNYFPTEMENKFPYFPDKILTVGETLRKVLSEQAYYPCPISVGAALRHQKFALKGDFEFHKGDKIIKKAVVYAFSYDLSNYRTILNALMESFGKSSVKVYLKIHPDYEETAVLKNLAISLPANFILAQKINWLELYKKVDCIFYDDNSIGLEGIIQGLKTFQFMGADPIYHCDRMYDFKLWTSGVDIQDMKSIASEIESETFDKSWDLEKTSEYVRNYYTPYKQETCFPIFTLNF